MKRVLLLVTVITLGWGAFNVGHGGDQLFEPLLGPGEELILQNGDILARLEDGSLVVVSEDGTVKNTFPPEAKIYRDAEKVILVVSKGATVRLGKYKRYSVATPPKRSRSEVLENLEKDFRPKPPPFEHNDPLHDRWQ
jgi:hypothetical protein